jgi:hypothetical protein
MNAEQARLVERLHAALVEEIRTRRPEYLQGPFTVAEIYQELVPYRNYRDQIGAAMNGDYEDALLRLLSGSGGYLVLESEPARKRLQEELQSNNPNTGIFREYAALDVRLNQARLPPEAIGMPAQGAAGQRPAGSAPPAGAPTATGATAGAAPAAASRPAAHAQAQPGRAPSATHSPAAAHAQPAGGVKGPVTARLEQHMQPQGQAPAATEAQATTEGATCRWCREQLPKREKMRFCPFCGMDVKLVPCRACGEEMEPEWRFCIACGTQVASEE